MGPAVPPHPLFKFPCRYPERQYTVADSGKSSGAKAEVKSAEFYECQGLLYFEYTNSFIDKIMEGNCMVSL